MDISRVDFKGSAAITAKLFSMDIVWQAEGSLREKKTEGDLKDVLKTLVCFANSVAPGDTAMLFIGERDDGTVQGVTNADNIQKKVKDEAAKIYPEIYYRTSVYERDGKQCVRVDVKHNGLAPHFGGAAWVRRGSVTVKATEELYQQMVEMRQSKVSTLMKWLNKQVTVEIIFGSHSPNHVASQTYEARLIVANAHWLTLESIPPTGAKINESEPLERVLISWDDKKQRLKILISSPF